MGRNAINIVGKKFGMLSVISNIGRNKYRPIYFCLCDCGGSKITQASDLRAGKVKSCGCLRYPTGKNNSNWKGGKKRYICKSCGEKFERYESHLNSKTHTNEFCSASCNLKYQGKKHIGEKHHNYKPAIIRQCGFCGKDIKVKPHKLKYKNNFCKRKKGEKCSKCHIAWMMQTRLGKNNANWRNGAKQNPYCEVWLDQDYKQSIKDRDGNKCMNYRCKNKSKALHIHHIDGDKLNCHPSNLITLCNSCHSLSNFQRKKHEVYYKQIMSKHYEYDYQFQSGLLFENQLITEVNKS